MLRGLDHSKTRKKPIINIDHKSNIDVKLISKPITIIKIKLLQNSQAKDYFESKERLFLTTVLLKLQNDISNELTLSDEEKYMLENIFVKYKKYL